MPESVLCESARRGGASCVEIDGWMVADAYGDPEGEYRAIRTEAALVDLAYRDRLRVTGADRIDFLQGMLSNDIKALAEGRGCPALLLTEQGKVVGDLLVLRLPEAVLLEGMRSGTEASAAALGRYIVADDVEIDLVGETEHTIGLYGPAASGALERLGIDGPPAVDWAFGSYDFLGTKVRIVRVPTPGRGGFVCHLARGAVTEWWSGFLRAGVRPAGQRAFDAIRIESGVPWYGSDVTTETLALEAPFEAAISFRKGCYLGQEVVERVTARGRVNRRLVGLEVEGRNLPAVGDRLYAGDDEVGRLTSAAWSWRLRCPVALAYVGREHWEPGTVLRLRGDDRSADTKATVRGLPMG